MSIQGKNPNATDNFLDVRAIFTKKDRAKYISHLDLYRAMQRAFKRAKLQCGIHKDIIQDCI